MNCCEIGTYECYIDIKIPLHMHQYIKNRKDKGFSGSIQVDKCPHTRDFSHELGHAQDIVTYVI